MTLEYPVHFRQALRILDEVIRGKIVKFTECYTDTIFLATSDLQYGNEALWV